MEEERLKVLKAAAVGLAFASPSVAALTTASVYLAAVLALGLMCAGLMVGVMIFNKAAFQKALATGAVVAGIGAFLAYPFSAIMAAPAALVMFILGVLLGLIITVPGASFVLGCGLFSILMMGTGMAAGALTGNAAAWVVCLFVLSAFLALYMPPLATFQRALLAALATASMGITGWLLGLSFGAPAIAALGLMSLGAFVSIIAREEGVINLAFHSTLASVLMGLGFIAAFFTGLARAWVPLFFTISVVAGLFLFRSSTRLVMLLAIPLDLFAAFGFVIGSLFRAPLGPVVIALVLAVDLDILLYFASDTWILWLNKAKVVTEARSPRAYSVAKRTAAAAGLPVPRIAIVPSEAVNLFAVGRSPGRAVIALTQGLLDRLGDDELEGLLAHELAHIKDRDLVQMTMACALATPAGSAMGQLDRDKDRSIGLPSRVATAVVAPFFALLVHLSMPRVRETRADSEAVKLTNDPGALATALEKLEKAVDETPVTANPATGPLFAIDPFRGHWMAGLFATHPATEDRLDILRRMGKSAPSGPAKAPAPRKAPAPAGGN